MNVNSFFVTKLHLLRHVLVVGGCNENVLVYILKKMDGDVCSGLIQVNKLIKTKNTSYVKSEASSNEKTITFVFYKKALYNFLVRYGPIQKYVICFIKYSNKRASLKF